MAAPTSSVTEPPHAKSMETQCPVCWEIPVEPQTLHPCKHVVCLHCVKRWSIYSRVYYNNALVTCPICKVQIESHDLNKELEDQLKITNHEEYNQRVDEIRSTSTTSEADVERSLLAEQRDTPTNANPRSGYEGIGFEYELNIPRLLTFLLAGVVISFVAALINIIFYLLLVLVVFALPFVARAQRIVLWYWKIICRVTGRFVLDVLLFYVSTLIVSAILLVVYKHFPMMNPNTS